jgi:hypothetical protein
MTSDLTGSSMRSRGIRCRAPMSACPVRSRTKDGCTALIPLATRPAHPMHWRFTPAVPSPAFSCPVSSSAPTVMPPFLRFRLAASSRPAAANLLTSLIAASSSQVARFSSRCALSGARSPACSAIDHPLRAGSSLASADTYFPACSHVCARAKHCFSRPSSSTRFRHARPAPILAAAAAFDSYVITST